MSSEGLGIQFRSLEQQKEAYRLGAWVFVASEVMLFSGLFLVYLIGHLTHFQAFKIGSHELNLTLGTVNTALLLTSSLFMAIAVKKAEEGRMKAASLLLVVTALMGIMFLGIKGFEWYEELKKARVPGINFSYHGPHAPGVLLFFWFYFTSTVLHALHVTVGVFSNLWFALVCRFRPQWIPDPSPVVIAGIYWHLVDLVWIFLFPFLYLVGGIS